MPSLVSLKIMSKIGQKAITIPQGAQVTVDYNKVTVKGPKGELNQTFRPEIKISVKDGIIEVKRINDSILAKSLHGLSRTLINNMTLGVTEGFSKQLKIVGTGYRAKVENKDLILTVGFSHPVKIVPPAGIEFNVKDNVLITITGYDKQLVGQISATIRNVRPPDPYKGKGLRYIDEVVRKKSGKAAAKAAAA